MDSHHLGRGHHHESLSPESKPSSPATDSKPKLRTVERGSQACNECRRHKIRCHPAPDDPDHVNPCARCVRMSLECVFKKHNRGRKRKNPPANDSQETPLAPKRQEDAPSYWNRASPDRALFGSAARYPFMALEPPREEPVQPQRPPLPASMSLRSMVHSEWDDEEDSYSSDQDERPAMGHAGDPLSLGYVTLEEAKILYNLFVKNFNIAMPILDPVVHTHDFVRHNSPFLYTVILCIGSRYMSALGNEPIPLSSNSAHQQIAILARDHLLWAFAEAVSTVDVVQAIVGLSLWKEPDDDKAAFYFNRAIVLARELDLGRDPSAAEVARMTAAEKRELRFRQRLWLSLFSTNSIFHMQFQQPMLISHTDPLVSTSTLWLKRGLPDQVLIDTFAAFSTDLRRRYLHYRTLLTEGQPSGLTLSVLTKTMNKEWEVTTEAWIREIIDAGGTPAYVHKPRVWSSSLGLNLNLSILNQTLRIAPSERIPPAVPALGRGSAAQLRSIPAFHYCLNAASSVLLRFHDLDKSQLTYASDTLLHFALYAATFLWSLCRTPELYDFESAEVDYTRDLILKVALAFEEASAYPDSSPALHARHLRRLCRTPSGTSHPHGHDRTQSYSESERTPIDPALTGPNNPLIPLPGANAGGELDFLLTDFQWAGVELPWTAVDPTLMGPNQESVFQHGAAAVAALASMPSANGRYPASQIV